MTKPGETGQISNGWTQPGLGKLVLLSVLSLALTSPFFLYPLFERPSLSQIHYLTVTSLALTALYALFALFSKGNTNLKPLIPAWLFCASLVLSALGSDTISYSTKQLLFTLGCVGVFSALFLSGPGQKGAKKIILLFCLVGFLTSLYGIAQNYGFEILGYAESLKKGKLNVISIFGHPNYLAAYLTPLLVIMIHAFFYHPGAGTRIFSLLGIVTLLVCLLLAGTRGAWLSLIVSVPFLLLFQSRMRRKHLPWARIVAGFFITALILAILITLILPRLGPKYDLKNRLEDKMPLLSRFYSWRIAGEMLKSRPLIGVGYGRYKVLYWDYVNEFQKRPASRIYDYFLNYGKGTPPLNVHNEYLEIAAEAGLLGFGCFILFLVLLLHWGWLTLSKPLPTDETTTLLPGILAAIVCILVDSIFNFPLHQPLSAFLFWMLAGLVLSEYRTHLIKSHA